MSKHLSSVQIRMAMVTRSLQQFPSRLRLVYFFWGSEFDFQTWMTHLIGLDLSNHHYGGPDRTKINNLVFTDLVLHYGQKDLDFENDEPIKKRPPFKEISAPIMGDRDEQGVRAQIGTDENAPYC